MTYPRKLSNVKGDHENPQMYNQDRPSARNLRLQGSVGAPRAGGI